LRRWAIEMGICSGWTGTTGARDRIEDLACYGASGTGGVLGIKMWGRHCSFWGGKQKTKNKLNWVSKNVLREEMRDMFKSAAFKIRIKV